jgi:hypothetical protein
MGGVEAEEGCGYIVESISEVLLRDNVGGCLEEGIEGIAFRRNMLVARGSRDHRQKHGESGDQKLHIFDNLFTVSVTNHAILSPPRSYECPIAM